MANKKAPKLPVLETLETVITKAKKINTEAIKLSDNLVEEGLATGAKFQKIMARSMVKGTDLLEKQQDLTVEQLEDVKNLYIAGTKRFRKLFNIDKLEAGIKKAAKKVTETAEDIKQDAEKAIDNVEDEMQEAKTSLVKSTMAIVKDAKKTATKVINKVTAEAKPKTAKKATKKTVAAAKKKATTTKKTVSKTATKAAKATKTVKKASTTKVAQPAAKKVNTTVKTTTKTAVAKDLTLIKGIGPKMASILKEGGLDTIAKIASANATDIKTILISAGPRYKMFEPQVWIDNAKTLK